MQKIKFCCEQSSSADQSDIRVDRSWWGLHTSWMMLQRTVHCTVHMVYDVTRCTVHTSWMMLQKASLQRTVHTVCNVTVHSALCHSAQCTMSQCTVYYVAMSECTAHDSTGQYTVQYTGQCTVQCRRQCTVQYTVHSAAHSAQCTLTVHSAECGTTVKIALSQPEHAKLWLQHAVIMWSKKQTKSLNNVNNWKIVQ